MSKAKKSNERHEPQQQQQNARARGKRDQNTQTALMMSRRDKGVEVTRAVRHRNARRRKFGGRAETN